MADEAFDYEDVTVYTLESEDEERLLKLQNECTFIWANKEGWPVGVIMSYYICPLSPRLKILSFLTCQPRITI